jgi:hypothetical protein
MRRWSMQVLLNRDVADVEGASLRDALPSMTALAYSTQRGPKAAIELSVEAVSRREAEAAAVALVSAVVEAADIEGVVGSDDVMQNRQVMFWLLATRQLLRWMEARLAERVGAGLRRDRLKGDEPLIWDEQLATHLTLVAARNLLRALKFADDRFPAMPKPMARDVEIQRDVNEHWDEQWPSFYNPSDPGPLTKSGSRFAKRHPGRWPYPQGSWNSEDGPTLAKGINVGDLHEYLDGLEVAVLAVAPDLRRFKPNLPPSPWLGDEHGRDRWWPA